jgi:hypothetical protein
MRGTWLFAVVCALILRNSGAYVSFMEKYHGQHSKAYHRHSYPVIVHNVCSLRGEVPVGSDGSVLIRRFGNVPRAVSLFCGHHGVPASSCDEFLAVLWGHISTHEDEYNWMLHGDEDGVLRVNAFTFCRV